MRRRSRAGASSHRVHPHRRSGSAPRHCVRGVGTATLERQARDIAERHADRRPVAGQVGECGPEEAEPRRRAHPDHRAGGEERHRRGPRDDRQAIEDTTQAYRSVATMPGERDTWERTRKALTAANGATARALALSRVNRDSEARDVDEGCGVSVRIGDARLRGAISITIRDALKACLGYPKFGAGATTLVAGRSARPRGDYPSRALGDGKGPRGVRRKRREKRELWRSEIVSSSVSLDEWRTTFEFRSRRSTWRRRGSKRKRRIDTAQPTCCGAGCKGSRA